MEGFLTLEQLVGQAIDMYRRDYGNEEEFWDEENFKVLVVAYLCKLYNDEYDDKKSRNRAEAGFGIVEFPGEWLVHDDVEVKEKDGEKYIETKQPFFSFTFDAMTSAVHSIRKVSDCDCTCGEFLRLSNKDWWMVKRLPPTSNRYWYGMEGKLVFPCAPDKQCLPKKLRVTYLPQPTMESDCAFVPAPYVTVILTTVLNQLFGAKQGQPVIDTTNDGNSNVSEQTESNMDSLKQK